jgi:phosphoglycolate phosphatase
MNQRILPIKHNPISIRLITTDWSGVISDDRKPLHETNMRVLDAHGKSRLTFDEWLLKSTMTALEFFAGQGISSNPQVLFEEFRSVYTQVRKEGLNPVAYADSKEVLKFFSGIGMPLIVVSSHPEDYLINEAIEYGIKNYITAFEGTVTDKTEGILKACLRAGEKPENTLYIGDMVYDIRAAKKAGVYSVAVTTGYHTKERLADEKPDLIVASLTHFKNAISDSLLRRQ